MGSMPAGKQKAVQLAMDQIERQFGKGSIMQLGGQVPKDVPVISTGSLALDHALGVGGIPRGRVTEIFGPESGGKTTLALHIMAEAQKRDGLATFIDSLLAIKILVFDQKRFILSRFLKIVLNNFNGNEALRQEIINKLPKYGTANSEADNLSREMVTFFYSQLNRYKNIRGGKFRPA